jgi:hypothetical protein
MGFSPAPPSEFVLHSACFLPCQARDCRTPYDHFVHRDRRRSLGPDGILCVGIASKDVITGAYTCDPKALDTNADPTVGNYEYNAPSRWSHRDGERSADFNRP